jgi:hypothetical protein
LQIVKKVSRDSCANRKIASSLPSRAVIYSAACPRQNLTKGNSEKSQPLYLYPNENSHPLIINKLCDLLLSAQELCC